MYRKDELTMRPIPDACSVAYQRKVRQEKSAFLNHQNIDADLFSPEILHSWKICKNLNLDPVNIPEIKSSNKKLTIENINPFKKYILSIFHTFHRQLSDTLTQLNAAMLFLDHNLQVYHKEGNPELLTELKKKNIAFGASFAEEEAGTNSAALTKKTQKCCWVIGQQHYKDVLSDYVSYTHNPITTITESQEYTLIIIPYSKFNSAVMSIFEYISESYCQLTNFQTLPQVTLTTNVLEHYLNQNHAICIITDSNEDIIFTNQYFYQLFGKRTSQTIGTKLKDLLPEVTPYISNQSTSVKSKGIIFNSLKENSKAFLIDYDPIYIGGTKLGNVVILTEKNHMAKQINKINNSGTYFTVDNIIGNSPEMLQIKEVTVRSAKTDSNVLITGESGTGKEMIAQSLHNASDRRNQPFISVNCAAIPKELIESELFGYSEGAFTGAKKSGSPGKFELADQGSLFLDEIGEMPLNMQTVLLRVLENRKITRLGGTTPINVDIRLITATNCNLWDLVNQKLFRMDLYFRLNVVNIQTLPLRRLTSDLPLLIQHFLNSLSSQYDKNIPAISDEVLHFFRQYSWPGNIRELRNVLERITIFNDSRLITMEDIPPDLLNRMNNNILTEQPNKFQHFNTQQNFDNYAEYEKHQILNLLAKYRGNKTSVAKELGISRRTLYTKIKKYNI